MNRLARLGAITRWIVGVGAATTVVLLFSLEGAPEQVDTASDELQRLVDDGRVIYDQRCASCHGNAGQGGQGPRLAGTVVTNFPDAAEEIAVVAEGRNGMPAFSLTLSDDDIAAVVAFTRFGLS